MKRFRTNSLAGALVLALTGAASAITWDVTYDGSVLPDAATPAWDHEEDGGFSEILSGDILRMTDPESWYLADDPLMTDPAGSFLYNDPDVAGEDFVVKYGRAFTIEWRMKVNYMPPGTVANDSQTGMKLEYMGYADDKRVQFEWYYDIIGGRLPNGRYKDSVNLGQFLPHEGRTGPEGAETQITFDGFPAIALGEWHTYKVTSATDGSIYTRELWLDGNYVGRWWDDKNGDSTDAQLKIRAYRDLPTSADVEFDYVRFANEADGRFIQPVPVLPQTLLVNQSFEMPAGSAQGWYGYFSDNLALVPNPPFMDGGRRLGIGRGEPGPYSTTTWQTVPINAGETVTFNGYIHAGIQGNATSSATITLYDGAMGGTQIDARTVDHTTPWTDGDWVKVTLGGVTNSGSVTVALTTALTATWTDFAAVHADGFTLTSSGPCAAQHTLSSILPVSGPHNADVTGAILSGTNLDQVTAVKLVQIPATWDAPTIIPGTITNVTPGALTIDFPTNGKPFGKYNVVAEVPSCITQQMVDEFEIVCANPTTLSSVSPASVALPQGVVQLTLSGANLDAITEVKLVRDATEIAGTGLTMVGSDLQVSFDLTGASEGSYDVVATRSDACADPDPLAAGFEIICPNPTTLSSVSPPSLAPPQGVAQLTLSGANLDAITEVKLVKGASQIAGTGLTMVGSDLQVSFDLTGAAEGFYDVVATRPDGCVDPAPLVSGFSLLPILENKLLTNGGFETSMTPWTGGCTYMSGPEFGLSARAGTGYTRAASNWGVVECSVEQALPTLPNGPGEYGLTLIFWGWVWDTSFPTSADYASWVKGEIVVDGAVVAGTAFSSEQGSMSVYSGQAVSWSGTANNSIAVRLTLRGDGRGGDGWGIAGVDDVELYSAGPSCNNPFADADGDHDVDQADFSVLQRCFTGSAGTIPTEPAYCACFDRPVQDGLIDQSDVTKFEDCASGPGVEADTACDGAP